VRGRRLDAASGFVAAPLILAGFALSAQAPPPSAPVAELAAHLADKRDAILAGDLLVGAGAMFYLWFLAALRTHLAAPPADPAAPGPHPARAGLAPPAAAPPSHPPPAGARGEHTLSALVLAGGTAAMTIVVAGVALQAGLVLDASTLEDAGVLRLGFDGYNALITIAGFGFALTVAATSGSAQRSGALGRRLRATGWLTAAAQLATLPGMVATSGPFAPAAPVPVIAFWMLSAWSVAVSIALFRAARPAL
jgi:hypothetical protein